MKYYGLYKITNLVNGKMYIGKHITDDLDDGYMGSGKILKYAICKYGVECFRKEWLGFYEDEEQLNYMERVFVDDTWVSRSDTYNLKVGGEGGAPKGTNKGKSHRSWAKGRKFSTEYRNKISEGTRKAMNRLTPDKRERLGAPRLGKPAWNRGKKMPSVSKSKMKPVGQFLENGELVATFNSALSAQEVTGIPRSSICHCLKGRYKRAGGFLWKYL